MVSLLPVSFLAARRASPVAIAAIENFFERGLVFFGEQKGDCPIRFSDYPEAVARVVL